MQKRNKQLTIEHLKKTALTIIKKEGIKELRVNRLEKESGMSKRLVYDYFGSIENLLKIVLKENDPWQPYAILFEKIKLNHKITHGKELATILLKKQLSGLLQDRVMQEINLLALTNQESETLKKLSQGRNELVEKLFSLSTERFENTTIDFPVIFALLTAGINYLILYQNKQEESLFGIDLHDENSFQKLHNSIEQIMSLIYKEANVQQGKPARI
ncbi:TetR/AcrR family transcriptional regulator [Sphingobacterium sp. MYb382]|uniref:TetR/AcrR family transcriptional regulator n=1 Tax=Sphingobacterium sp. MYb382 TaxID=2745278 RepID=UPI0030A4B6A0